MQWETYTEKVLDESFLARIEQLNSIVQQLDPQQKSYTTGRLNLARQEWEANRTQTPGHLFRPAALKLANVTKIIAQGLLQLGLPADAAVVSNFSFEVYRSFQHDKYLTDLAETLQLYARSACIPATTPLDEAFESLSNIIDSLPRQFRSPVELGALNGLASSYDEYLHFLKQQDRIGDLQEYLSANLEAMIKLCQKLGSREAAAREWTQTGQDVVPNLIEQLVDQGVLKDPKSEWAGLPKETVATLQRAVQELGYHKVFELLESRGDLLRVSLAAAFSRESDQIVDPPPTVKDSDARITAAFRDAMEQRSHNIGQAIATLEEAYRLNPGNARVLEWLGTLYLRQTPPNLLRARRYLESVPSRWISYAKDWNLSLLYRRLQSDERQRAFELLRNSFLAGPRTSTLHASLALALELNHLEYLVAHLREVVLFEAAAYGFTVSYQQKDRAAQDIYLLQLESYLAEGVPTLPSINLILNDFQIDGLLALFTGRHLVDAGIVHFEDRYRRYARSEQGHRLLPGLIGLLEAAGRFERALECKRHQVEIELETNLAEWQRIARLQELLRYCRERDLKTQGLELLDWAAKRNIVLTSEQSSHWRTHFGGAPPITERGGSGVVDLGAEHELPPSGSAGLSNGDERPLAGETSQSEANRVLATTNPEIDRLRTFGSVLEHRIKIQNALAAVESLYGTKAQPLTDQIRQILATLEEYQAQPDHERRQAVIQRLVQLKIGLERKYAGISDRDMTNCLAPTMRAMARSVGDAAIAVNAAPTVNLRTLNTYLSSLSDASTTLVAEVENQSDLPVSSVEVRLRLGRGTFTVAPDDANASLPEGLLPKGRRIVTFPIRRNPTKAGDREIVLLSGTFDAEGMTSLPLHDESQELPVQPFKSVIGGEGRIRNPYIATGAVPFERPENFHGRGELLNRIRGSVADQESREVLFLNGIRRIGKTSLLNMLEGAPPSGLIPVKVRLDVINPDSTGMFLYSLAALIVQKVEKHAKLTMDPLNLQSPEALEAFELRPQIEFPRVLDLVAPYLGGHKLFLMFDEFQLITEAIQRARSEGKTSRIDVNLLDMLRGYLEERRFLALFTGSLLFTEIRQHVPDYNRLWGSIAPIDAGFVDRDAVSQILCFPARKQNINYTDAAVDRAFDYTQGYPWFVQMMGTEIVGVLNAEERLVVSPQDVDVAAGELVGRDYNFDGYWWERSRLEPRLDGPILRTILDTQQAEWTGLPSAAIIEAVKRSGLPAEAINQRILKLRQFHILDRTADGRYRIKALILERWIRSQRDAHDGELPFGPVVAQTIREVAIVLDHENIWFGLVKMRETATDRKAFMAQTTVDSLIAAWTDHAQKYGRVAARVAVADWHNQNEVGPGRHQQAYRTGGFETPLPFTRGPQVADHEIRDQIAELRLKQPDIDVYVLGLGDGDYGGMVERLLNDGKQVVIWSLRDSLHRLYEPLRDRRGLRIECIEDILSLPEF